MLLYSSFESEIHRSFLGWCWAEHDLIVGSEGAARYQQERGHAVKPGLDGCYVCASPTPEGLLLGTDSRGLSRLFVYKDATSWAVGSSLRGLVDHLRSYGKHLTPNKSALAPLSQRGNLTSQMTSTETIFEGIELVPSYVQLLISASGRMEFIETPVQAPTGDYSSSLSDYINLWRSRLATLILNKDTNISVDLSGGIDSRTVLAFFMSLQDVSEPNERFRFASSTGREKDFAAASKIAAHYGFDLNGKRPKRPKRSEHAGLRAWKANSLGVYRLVYFDGSSPDPDHVHAHGAGGGNFRPIVRGTDMRERLLPYAEALPTDLYNYWQDAVQCTMKNLTEWNPHANPMVLHYREFRNRFHFGHKPHSNIMFTPLNSGMTDPMTDGDSAVGPQQFYFDIMESLSPGLKDFPYDDKRKMPRGDHHKGITCVPLLDPSPGRVFGEPPSSPSDFIESSRSAYDMWVDEASQAVASEDVKSFLWGNLHERTEGALAAARGGGKLPSNSPESMQLSFAISADFALRGGG